MKNIFYIADPPEGGGTKTKTPTVEERLAVLEANNRLLGARIGALESAGPKEVRLAPAVIKSERQHLEEELAELKTNPKNRIALLTKQNVPEKAAKKHVEGRIDHLEEVLSSLAGKAAAVLLALCFLLSAFSLKADQQGYPQQYVFNTNFPAVLAGSSGQSNLLSANGSVSYNLTNEVILHRGAGVGLEWFYQGVSGALTTNVTLTVQPSVDGTNIDAFQAWTVYGRCAGPTNVCVTTNWSPVQLAGYKALFITQESNACPTIVTNGQTPAGGFNVAGVTTNYPTVIWNVPQGGP